MSLIQYYLQFCYQVMLQRHVNSHFSETPSGSAQTARSAARKSIESAPAARKVLKRAGLKLKFRKLPFSARIFDFFDAGQMAGIRDQVTRVHGAAARLNIVDGGDAMVFKARAMALRLGQDGQRQVKLKWIPEEM